MLKPYIHRPTVINNLVALSNLAVVILVGVVTVRASLALEACCDRAGKYGLNAVTELVRRTGVDHGDKGQDEECGAEHGES